MGHISINLPLLIEFSAAVECVELSFFVLELLYTFANQINKKGKETYMSISAVLTSLGLNTYNYFENTLGTIIVYLCEDLSETADSLNTNISCVSNLDIIRDFIRVGRTKADTLFDYHHRIKQIMKGDNKW